MDSSSNLRQVGSGLDATVDFGAVRSAKVGRSPEQPTHRQAPDFIEGSRPDLTTELLADLRIRLRLASLLLFSGFLLFLVLGLVTQRESLLEHPVHLGLHFLVTVITGLIGFRLCTDCQILRRHLRVAEILVFGGSVVYFASLSYWFVTSSAAKGYITPIVGPWFLLMFTYALFVPNSWQRALAVIGPMATIPLLVLIFAYATNPDVVRVISQNPDFRYIFIETALAMGVCATIAVWGRAAMRSLRQEVFEAKQLGQYRLKRLLGRGGMGEVYIAEHTLLKRPCAVKLIRPENAGNPQALARFEREVQATAALTHWNTVEIYDYGQTADGTFYYVMEYLSGMSLRALVDQYGHLAAGRVVYLLAQTCHALGEAHAVGLVHRDIKPANIFAAKRGRAYDVAKLLDFGLVRDQTLPQDDLTLTHQHGITGSPLFMSPEQSSGKSVDHRSDIYSLGVVAFVLLTGQPPFDADNAIQVIIAHTNQPPQKPSEIVPGIPADLDRIVLRCLAKDPNDRYQSVDDLRTDLLACSVADEWNEELAAEWWSCYGCPHKKRLDAAVQQGQVSEVDSKMQLANWNTGAA